jgi:hypothetical protein
MRDELTYVLELVAKMQLELGPSAASPLLHAQLKETQAHLLAVQTSVISGQAHGLATSVGDFEKTSTSSSSSQPPSPRSRGGSGSGSDTGGGSGFKTLRGRKGLVAGRVKAFQATSRDDQHETLKSKLVQHSKTLASAEDQAVFDHMVSSFSGMVVPPTVAAPVVEEKKEEKDKRVRRSFKKTVNTIIFLRRLGGEFTRLSDEVVQSLDRLTQWQDFDIFHLTNLLNGRPLCVVVTHLFEKLNVFDTHAISKVKLRAFFNAVEDGYKDVPYHNRVHATDVLQNAFFFLSQKGIEKLVTPNDIIGALVGAAIHDYGHPGVNNNFLKSTQSSLALRYNDQSILENMHVAEAFALMVNNDANNFLGALPAKDRLEIRATIINVVLATDMVHHFASLAELQATLEKKRAAGTQFTVDEPADRSMVLNTVLHCSDLGNPAKPLKICREWTRLLFDEFYAQGDRERELGMAISPMMDRDKPNMEKSQIFFIDIIVQPLFEAFNQVIPAPVCLDNLRSNRAFWVAAADGEKPPPPKNDFTPPAKDPLERDGAPSLTRAVTNPSPVSAKPPGFRRSISLNVQKSSQASVKISPDLLRAVPVVDEGEEEEEDA